MTETEMTYINTLLSDCQTITESYERLSRAAGENFNLFTILGLETKEVTTHSRFIAELLNPMGSHGRGEKFLELFLHVVGIKDFDAKGARVEVERSFPPVEVDGALTSGRIDIYIEYNGKVIMIENKVWAYEQVDQLRKYKAANRNGILFFLTLNGELSYQDDHEDINGKYDCISYREHIKNWLELCRKEAVDAPILRESITLYLNIVKKLTHQTIYKEMESAIVDRIVRDEYSLKAFGDLLSSHHAVVKKILGENFIEIVKSVCQELGLEFEMVNKFPNPERYAGIEFSNDILKNMKVKIGFQFEYGGWGKMFYGFFSGQNGKSEFHELKERFKSKFAHSVSAPTDYWPCSKYWNEYSNCGDPNILSEIRHGKFKNDFREKVKALYEVAIGQSLE